MFGGNWSPESEAALVEERWELQEHQLKELAVACAESVALFGVDIGLGILERVNGFHRRTSAEAT